MACEQFSWQLHAHLRCSLGLCNMQAQLAQRTCQRTESSGLDRAWTCPIIIARHSSRHKLGVRMPTAAAFGMLGGCHRARWFYRGERRGWGWVVAVVGVTMQLQRSSPLL